VEDDEPVCGGANEYSVCLLKLLSADSEDAVVIREPNRSNSVKKYLEFNKLSGRIIRKSLIDLFPLAIN
jgi:hypothetical protein